MYTYSYFIMNSSPVKLLSFQTSMLQGPTRSGRSDFRYLAWSKLYTQRHTHNTRAHTPHTPALTGCAHMHVHTCIFIVASKKIHNQQSHSPHAHAYMRTHEHMHKCTHTHDMLYVYNKHICMYNECAHTLTHPHEPIHPQVISRHNTNGMRSVCARTSAPGPTTRMLPAPSSRLRHSREMSHTGPLLALRSSVQVPCNALPRNHQLNTRDEHQTEQQSATN